MFLSLLLVLLQTAHTITKHLLDKTKSLLVKMKHLLFHSLVCLVTNLTNMNLWILLVYQSSIWMLITMRFCQLKNMKLLMGQLLQTLIALLKMNIQQHLQQNILMLLQSRMFIQQMLQTTQNMQQNTAMTFQQSSWHLKLFNMNGSTTLRLVQNFKPLMVLTMFQIQLVTQQHQIKNLILCQKQLVTCHTMEILVHSSCIQTMVHKQTQVLLNLNHSLVQLKLVIQHSTSYLATAFQLTDLTLEQLHLTLQTSQTTKQINLIQLSKTQAVI